MLKKWTFQKCPMVIPATPTPATPLMVGETTVATLSSPELYVFNGGKKKRPGVWQEGGRENAGRPSDDGTLCIRNISAILFLATFWQKFPLKKCQLLSLSRFS